jgi:hypothetical protein
MACSAQLYRAVCLDWKERPTSKGPTWGRQVSCAKNLMVLAGATVSSAFKSTLPASHALESATLQETQVQRTLTTGDRESIEEHLASDRSAEY